MDLSAVLPNNSILGEMVHRLSASQPYGDKYFCCGNLGSVVCDRLAGHFFWDFLCSV